MEASPLTQQARPLSFRPKIIQHYEDLFKDDNDFVFTEGFWREFFILSPNKDGLQRQLEQRGPDDLLRFQVGASPV